MEPFVVGALLYGKEGKNFENGGGGESKDEKCQSEQYVFKKSLGCTFFSSLATCCVP